MFGAVTVGLGAALEFAPRFQFVPMAAAPDGADIFISEGGAARNVTSSTAGAYLLNTSSGRPFLSLVSSGALQASGSEGEIGGASAGAYIVNSPSGDRMEEGRFSKFTFIVPANTQGAASIVADVNSPSAVGTATFTVGELSDDDETLIEVALDLQFQRAVAQIGIAPLHSMFLFAAGNRSEFDDYRPSVHSSEGLWMRTEDGQLGWRNLNNPPAVANSYFSYFDPSAFGFVQRERSFSHYQDADYHYERRPSLVVEPLEGWGYGFVRLIEAPSRKESADNIEAFWIPERNFAAGDNAKFRYRLRWSADTAQGGELATVKRFSAGRGGASGVNNDANLRKFVVDFVGSALGPDVLPYGPLDAFVSVSPGRVEHASISRLPGKEAIRVAIDAFIDSADPVEVRCYLIGGGRQLTETWMYQWRKRPL